MAEHLPNATNILQVLKDAPGTKLFPKFIKFCNKFVQFSMHLRITPIQLATLKNSCGCFRYLSVHSIYVFSAFLNTVKHELWR